jgi:hypothetical protein
MWSLVFLLFLATSVAAGYLYARWRYIGPSRPWKPTGVENGIVGLYGLLLSFAFLMSGNASREHDQVVYEHNDSFAMLFREARLLPSQDGDAVRSQVRRIMALEVQSIGSDESEREAIQAKATQLYDDLWRDVAARAARAPVGPDFRPALDQVQHAIALEYRLRFMDRDRTPTLVISIVVAGALLVGYLVGFMSGLDPRHHLLVPAIYFVLAGLAVTTILDLNNPRRGVLRPDSVNYETLTRQLEEPQPP